MFYSEASASASGLARATASAIASTSVSVTSSATSDVSQKDADNLALLTAQKEAEQLAIINANEIANNILVGNNELVIISALEEEFLINYSNDEKIKITLVTKSPFPTYRVITNDSECVYIVSGVGKANSAASVMYAINGLGAQKIVWFGTSGGALPKYNINDIVIIKKSIYIDADYTAFGYELGQMAGEDLFQYTSEDFSNLNYELLQKDTKLITYNDGTSGTCDQFVTNFELLDKFPPSYDIGLVDNENTSALQIINSLNKKSCIIRYISDDLTDSIDGQVQTFDKTLVFCSIFFRKYFYENLNAIKNF
jgi:adenosylhomocysteine nucleosidase